MCTVVGFYTVTYCSVYIYIYMYMCTAVGFYTVTYSNVYLVCYVHHIPLSLVYVVHPVMSLCACCSAGLTVSWDPSLSPRWRRGLWREMDMVLLHRSQMKSFHQLSKQVLYWFCYSLMLFQSLCPASSNVKPCTSASHCKL